MQNTPQSEETIFSIAAEIRSPDKRSAYLDQACGDDAQLRRRVTALLRRHEESQGVLDAPPAGVDETVELDQVEEHVGADIGPYKLMEQIGEGGMGVVYVAQQERPVQRKVALKIIKPGMDTKEVIARFEAERQALALMDHPAIAKVLDAGATESGRPYFAMELVRGIPITEYCDRKRLSTRERLKLFVATCHAIQHAHQKGIIHRDIKPTNVLVTEHDGKPLPKVIDFGVAKAINQRLTERTIYTRHQQMIGTPLYMSPEQADLSALDVDTRSDIYSLGVLLYELLTGVTPFDQKRFKEVAYDEMRRIIRDEDPPRPSTRISSLGVTAATITEHRRTDPDKLRRQLRGELDWVIMKSLDKERGRRYETANGLAEDVDRYLRDEAVLACPPSAVYRFRKFARRNKVTLATVITIGIVLFAATALSSWQWYRAKQAIAKLQDQLEETVLRALMAGDKRNAEQAIKEAEEAGVSDKLIQLFSGQLALYYGDAKKAIGLLEPIADDSVAARGLLATAGFYAQDIVVLDNAINALGDQVERAWEDLTFEDKLFAGQAMIQSDMNKGLELVEEAIQERRGSPLARMIHAQMLAAVAHNTGDRPGIIKALDEIKKAMRWVHDTPCLISTQHLVQSVAHSFELDKEADITIEQLRMEWRQVQTLPAGRMLLIRLLADMGAPDVPSLVRSAASMPEMTDGEWSFYIPILLLYETPGEVLDLVEQRRSTLGPFGEAAELRLIALQQGRDASERCEVALRQNRHVWTRVFHLCTLLLISDDEKPVRDLAAALLPTTELEIWYRRPVLEFLADRITEGDLIDGTAGRPTVYELDARLALAMLAASRGERQTVLIELQNCEETKARYWEDYWWARAFQMALTDEEAAWNLRLPNEAE